MGFAKIHVNASVSISRGTAGVVCRDHHGNYLGSSSLVIFGMNHASTLKTIVCREALELAEDLGLQSFVIAFDAKQVVSDLARGSRGRQGVIIDEITSRVASFTCNFSFEGRLVNEDAHELARFSLSSGQGRIRGLCNPMTRMLSHKL